MKGTYPEIPEHFSQDLKEILSAILVTNPKKRLNTFELIEHPVFLRRSLKYYPESFNDK